jgi:perosamine synthetase
MDEMNELRRKWSKQLNNALSHIEEIDLPVESKECKHTYQMYTIKIKNVSREKFIAQIREKGIGASVHFDPPVHLHKFYRENKFDARSLEVTEKLSNSIVTLPMFPGLKKEEVEYMADTIKDTIKTLRAKILK